MAAYSFDTVIDRKNTNSLKYDFVTERGYPKDVLPLWVADMDFKCPELVLKDLSLLGDQELTAIYITSGFTVTRIDLRCTEETLNIIKERSTQHD